MKKMIRIPSITICFLIFFVSTQLFSKNHIDDAIEGLETYHHHSDNIVLNEAYDTLLTHLTQLCSEESILQGQLLYTEIYNHILKKYKPSSLGLGTRLSISLSLFKRISSFDLSVFTLSTDNYCSLKYVILKFQRAMRNIHLTHLRSLGVDIEKLQNYENANVSHTIMKEVNQYTSEHDQHLLKEHHIDFEPTYTIDRSVIEGRSLIDEKKEIYQHLLTLFEFKVNKILHITEHAKIYDKATLTYLASHIEVDIIPGCQNSFGHFKLATHKNGGVLTPNHQLSPYQFAVQQNGDIYEFGGMNFEVNDCHLYRYVIGIGQRIEFVILHELGHYYYYMKDKTTEQFEDICRKRNGVINTDACSKNDFVSAYAMKAPHEDYAESFATFIINRFYGYSIVQELQKDKQQYFQELFQLGDRM